MQVSCGVDIIEIDRVKKSIENTDRFVKDIFTEKEIEYCESKRIAKYQHYAARFAAKEATFKAISRFLKNKSDISWKNIQVVNDENGKPNVEFVDVDFPQITSIDISISHSKDNAVAFVTVLYK
ncbi:MAG: holo-ACP synthase [Clostridia bacterium]|nr:holo-ACP synthase [Clostridia bacterium]